MNDLERELRELGEKTAERVTYREAPRARIVRRARLRRAAIVAAPVAAVVLFAAVAYPRLGSDLNRGVPVSVDLAAAAEATEDAGSARVEMSMTMEFGGRTITMDGEGKVDFDDSRSHFRLTGDGAVYGVAGEFEVISIGRTVFQRPVGDPKWVKTEVDVPAGGAPFGTGPDELFTYLESVSEDVTSLGEEVLDGVPVTHLRATLDTSALGEMATMPGTDYEPFDVWIDESNRVRKMTFGASMDGPDASSNGTMTMTMRFWDFGVPVDVAAPAPEDVTDELPATWDGPGGELIGGESSGGEGVTMVMGEARIDTPYVEVDAEDPAFIEACVLAPRPIAWATLVHEASGRRVFVFEPVHSDGHFEGPVPVACVEQGVAQADVDALVEDPTEFTLRVTRPDGSREIVRLTITASSLGSSVAVE